MPPRQPRHPFNAYSSDTDRHTGSGAAMQKHKKISKTEEKQLLELTNTMGNRITLAMEDQGLSISWLANKMTVVDRTVSDWRKDGNVSTHRIPLLAKYLNTTVEYLMTGAEAHAFQQVSGDSNVVQMQMNVESDDITRPSQSIVMRYVGIYELDEVRDAIIDEPDEWLDLVRTFATKPTERTSLAVTLNKDKLDQPGIPAFCLQYLIDGPTFERGTFLGYAIDIAPARGKFCLYALKKKGENKFTFANGYYYNIGDRMLASSSMGKSYAYDNKGFVLRLDHDNPSTDDVYCTPEDFDDWSYHCRLMGVATWRNEWLDIVAMRHHTGLWERLDRVYEGRRIRDAETHDYIDPDLNRGKSPD